MEPKLPMPQPSPERAPMGPNRVSNAPEVSVSSHSPEQAVEIDVERSVGEAREQLSSAGAAQFQSPPADLSARQGSSDDNGAPLVAADDDLIEQEWVKKAKNIVMATRDDPYSQEREVSKLQADYLQKRYGKEIKVSNR